ncbi:hypothetical protein N8H72_18325 [Pseudomonas koreensis]|uniref:hypothetical protein n=1 Tax=Pseudomonas koreensis TaxID=198620 RepID=UPI0021C708BF|nr:hypothetical protein [Pseudomonas koreensis]MCU0091936.1 hypothetical protein [Pseudomonas koreensis]
MQEAKPSASFLKLLVDSDFQLTMEVSPWLLGGLLGVAVLVLLYNFVGSSWGLRDFEIDEAEFGIGEQKIKLKPNSIDRQIAYKVWVELSTRKIGLQIDLENDVVYEIYDSWYSFFSVTRELIKDVPVSKFQRKETERIIRLSIDVLNLGLRPHLTKWHARYRRWHDTQASLQGNIDLEPQDLQRKYPYIKELEADILSVNNRLIGYREKMYKIVAGTH